MDWIFIGFSIVSGALISFFYFGGLWLTLRKIAEYNLSYWLVLVSFLISLCTGGLLCIGYLSLGLYGRCLNLFFGNQANNTDVAG